MPEYFVWSTPKLVRIIEARDELTAAAVYLDLPATPTPVPHEPPACFVQATEGYAAPRTDETTVEFWLADDATE